METSKGSDYHPILKLLSVTPAGVNRYEVDVMADGGDYAMLSSSVAGVEVSITWKQVWLKAAGSPSNAAVRP